MYVRPRFDNLITIEKRSWEFKVAKTYQLEQRERERDRENERESNTTVTVYRLCSSLFLA